MQEMQVWSVGWEDPLEKEMDNPLQYSCHGQKNLEGFSLWGFKESDMFERAHSHL